MHGEIMVQDQNGSSLGNGGKRKNSGFIDMCLVDKNKGDNYVVISLWLLALCYGSNEPCIQELS